MKVFYLGMNIFEKKLLLFLFPAYFEMVDQLSNELNILYAKFLVLAEVVNAEDVVIFNVVWDDGLLFVGLALFFFDFLLELGKLMRMRLYLSLIDMFLSHIMNFLTDLLLRSSKIINFLYLFFIKFCQLMQLFLFLS